MFHVGLLTVEGLSSICVYLRAPASIAVYRPGQIIRAWVLHFLRGDCFNEWFITSFGGGCTESSKPCRLGVQAAVCRLGVQAAGRNVLSLQEHILLNWACRLGYCWGGFLL